MTSPEGFGSSYADIANEAFESVVDALYAANQRSLAYARSFWESAMKPYSSTALEDVVPETFERADAIVKLSLDALQANGRAVAEFARKSAEIAVKAQESHVAVLRGIADTSVSNLNFLHDTAATLQSPQTVALSNN